MAIISDKLNKILSAVFGKDVRQALHDGLDAINKETESTTSRQDYLDRKYDEQIKNMTLQDPSSAEIVDMRVAANGKTFEKAGDRLNYFDEQLDTIKSEKRDKNDLIKSSELDKSQDGYKIQPENLSQSVHNMINGNAPAMTQIGYKQVTTENVSFLSTGTNMFDKSKAIKDKGIDGLGHYFDQTDYYVTDYIFIKSNTNYVFKGISKLEFYTSNKDFISGLTGVSDGQVVTTPSNAVYLRGLTYKTTIDSAIISEGTDLPVYEAYKLKTSENIDYSNTLTNNSIKAFLESQLSLQFQNKSILSNCLDIVDKNINLFNENTAIANTTIDGIGNQFAQVDYYVSDFIKIKPSTVYNRKNYRFHWYDINKTFISGSTSSPPDSNTPITSPSNAYYIKVAMHKNDLDTFMIVEGSEYPTTYIPYGYSFNNLVSIPIDLNKYRWHGKKWYVCGDSITANLKYQAPVSKLLKLSSYTTDGNPGQQISGCVSKIITNPSLLDGFNLLTIFAGTNDFGGNKELGDINSPSDTTTTYGSLKQTIEVVQQAQPTLRIVLITPLPRGKFDTQPSYGEANAKGYKLVDYVNAVKEVGELYHIPVLDLYNLSGFNQFNISSFTSDNLHPNDLGNERMYPIIAKFLETL